MKFKHFFIFITILTTLSPGVLSARGMSTDMDSYEEQQKLKIANTPQNMDSLISVWYRENIISSYESFVNDFIDIDVSGEDVSSLPDSIYRDRLNMLASVVKLPYNSVVKKYINVYTNQKSGLMRRILGLAQYYMPFFEQELDIQGLPSELKILPIIESALNPKAVSPAGAGGLWQFMLKTGKYYGLESNSFVDERLDPIASTKAACRYLKDMFSIYNDWTLVIAAYNCGPGNVNKAIKRAPNAKTFWDIYEFLPRETRNYIPAFIAATYAYTFHKAHDLDPVSPPHPIITDTIQVNRMLHFGQISSTIGVSEEMLRDLNPQYKLDIIPAKTKSYALVLPVSEISNFIDKEEDIYGKEDQYLKDYMNISSDDPVASNITVKQASGVSNAGSGSVKHKVKSGENLGGIANKYGVKVSSIMKLNGIKDPRKLKPGQILIIK